MFFDDDNQEAPAQPPIAIPPEQLSEEVINAVIEAFILREGTDYGTVEITMDKKKEQVRRQLDKKEILIVYDFNTDSVTIMPETAWKKLQKP